MENKSFLFWWVNIQTFIVLVSYLCGFYALDDKITSQKERIDRLYIRNCEMRQEINKDIFNIEYEFIKENRR